MDFLLEFLTVILPMSATYVILAYVSVRIAVRTAGLSGTRAFGQLAPRLSFGQIGVSAVCGALSALVVCTQARRLGTSPFSTLMALEYVCMMAAVIRFGPLLNKQKPTAAAKWLFNTVALPFMCAGLVAIVAFWRTQ